jgi:excisionase family DNA binding protein
VVPDPRVDREAIAQPKSLCNEWLAIDGNERHATCHCLPRDANRHRYGGSTNVTDSGFLTTTEALEYLRTSSRTLYRHLAANEIRAVRVGHQWRFRKADLDQWLARKARGPAAPDVHAPNPPAPQRARVLLADDEPTICELLKTILDVTGSHIESAFDGMTALERLRASPFDLLVTDLRMPGMDGTALARGAKRLRPAIKIMIVTGQPSQSSAIDAVNIGVDGYLLKPFHPMDVLMATARALNLGSLQEHSWSEATPR